MAKTTESIKDAGFYQFYPVVPCIVLVKSGEKLNGMSVAWNTALSFDPPLFGILVSPKRYTYSLLKEAGEFTANFVDFEHFELYGIFGRLSGREINKIEAFGIETEPSLMIRTPLLKNIYAAYECKIVDECVLGDHVLFAGEVLTVHYENEVFPPPKRLLDVGKISPAFYLGSDHYLRIKDFERRKFGLEEVKELLSTRD